MKNKFIAACKFGAVQREFGRINMSGKNKTRIFFLGALAATFLSACSTYEEEARKMRGAWMRGDFPTAKKIASENAKDASPDDRLVWELDTASVLRGMQKKQEAQQALEKAAGTLAYWDEQAEILISKEVAATVSDLSALPYRGRSFERIMLQTYRALSLLENGKRDEARVALNAAFKAQSEAVERNAEEIKAAQENAEKESVDIDGFRKRADVAAVLDRKKSPLADVAVYADYVNPFTTWLHGIYFLRAGTDGGDFERGRKSLERVAQMEAGNAFVREDCAATNAQLEKEATTYVIFEYGVAPSLKESRVDLFLPVPTGRGNFTIAPVSIALPELSREHTTALPSMTANGVPAQTICDMNRIVKTDFENAYPAVLSRTLTTAFLKAAASVAANVAAQEYARRDGSAAASLVALGTMIGSSIFTYATSEADIRAWQTLPENFSIVRLKTPRDRVFSVSVGGRSREVKLISGQINVVWVKSVGVANEPSIAQFILK